MKSLSLEYLDTFPATMVSGWSRRPLTMKIDRRTVSGQRMRPRWERNPYFTSRRKWCLLTVELDRVVMWFATPEELDHVRDVFRHKVLQRQMLPHPYFGAMRRMGSPNNHWLSRLPARAKSMKWRQKFENLVSKETPEMKEFRAFYAVDEGAP